MTKRSTLGSALIALGLATTSLGFLSTGTASADPGGNNSTVKVEDVEVDNQDSGNPENNPHLPCTFTVEWYNFDEGEGFFSDITFELQDPTATGRTMSVNGPSHVFIGEDPADGVGTGPDNGLDARETYTLSFTGAPQENQGFHVKITTDSDGSRGADVKHKTFWVGPCAPPPPPPPADQCPDSENANPGDANGDGQVNAEDCDYTPPPADQCPDSENANPGDANGDGDVNAEDCDYTPPPPPPPGDQCPNSENANPGDANGDGDVNAEDCDYTPPPPPPPGFECPEGFDWVDLNGNDIEEEGECVQVLPTSSTAPTEPTEPTSDTTPTVKPSVRTSNPGGTTPAVAPTAVDAGLIGDAGDSEGVPSFLLVLLGAAMAVLGLGVGFVPVVARGKHSR